MPNVSYGATFDSLMADAQTIVNFFNEFFEILNVNLWTFIGGGPDGPLSEALPSWLITALEAINADAFLGQFTLFGSLFSLIIVGIIVAYFFIP